jgi:CBS domain-containing protein
MKVRDVMATVVHSCRPHTNLAEAAESMWNFDCGSLPVVDHDGKVIGMITDRDICMAVATKGRIASHITVWETMTGKAYTCGEDDEAKAALRTMAAEKVRRLPVADQGGMLRGFLSINDLVLQAGEAKWKGAQALSREEVLDTLKKICGHRVLVGI